MRNDVLNSLKNVCTIDEIYRSQKQIQYPSTCTLKIPNTNNTLYVIQFSTTLNHSLEN